MWDYLVELHNVNSLAVVCGHSLVDELCADSERLSHVAQGEGAVGL